MDVPNPLIFLELRPSGNREEAPVLLLCAFQVRKSQMNQSRNAFLATPWY